MDPIDNKTSARRKLKNRTMSIPEALVRATKTREEYEATSWWMFRKRAILRRLYKESIFEFINRDI